MKIKNLKHKLVVLAILMGIIIASLIYIANAGRTYTLYIKDSGHQYEGGYVEMSESGIISASELYRTGNYIAVKLTSIKKGSTVIDVNYTDANGEVARVDVDVNVRVNNLGMIVYNGNIFSGWLAILYGEALIYLVLAISFWLDYGKNSKTIFYSFTTIMDMGLGIMFTILTAVYVILAAYTTIQYMDYNSNTAFLLTSNTLNVLVALSIPVVAVFALFMVTTNLSLIRHESFRVVNLLGIILSLVFIVAVGIVIYLKIGNGTGIDFTAKEPIVILQFVISALVCYAECMFAASAICCFYASKKKPAYDSDYVIILGCGIRKDGTLTPLLQGRVKGAIAYYNRRYELTGKKTYIIPSGGKGSDEIISESEAMSNYLIEQGIPKEQILMENKSVNTYENMLFSKRIIEEHMGTGEVGTVYFSTTSYHIFRSGMLAYEVGLNQAVGIGNKTKNYFWPNAFVREFIGMFVKLRKKLLLVIAVIIIFCTISGYFLL